MPSDLWRRKRTRRSGRGADLIAGEAAGSFPGGPGLESRPAREEVVPGRWADSTSTPRLAA